MVLSADTGGVAERGTHEQLMALDGIYASMVQAQESEAAKADNSAQGQNNGAKNNDNSSDAASISARSLAISISAPSPLCSSALSLSLSSSSSSITASSKDALLPGAGALSTSSLSSSAQSLTSVPSNPSLTALDRQKVSQREAEKIFEKFRRQSSSRNIRQVLHFLSRYPLQPVSFLPFFFAILSSSHVKCTFQDSCFRYVSVLFSLLFVLKESSKKLSQQVQESSKEEKSNVSIENKSDQKQGEAVKPVTQFKVPISRIYQYAGSYFALLLSILSSARMP